MLTNRKDAREAGDRFYLAARPCRNGHSSPRYVSTGHCSECLAAARGADQQQHRQAMAARFGGVRQFSYPLHPDDHAAAWAYCQALDLQRGVVPQAAPVVATYPPELAAAIAQRRAELLHQPTPAASHVPDELAGVLRHPTNGPHEP